MKHSELTSLKATLVTALLTSLLLATGTAHADQALASSKNCMSCHAMDKKLLGPSYKDIAAKYKGDKSAANKLVGKIIGGGSGAWGAVPMPANPQVNDAEAKKLVAWILSQ